MTKYTLLYRPLWMRSDQFHPRMWDESEAMSNSCYPMMAEGNWIKRRCDYTFKEWRHRCLNNM